MCAGMRSRSLVFFALSLAACAAPSADEDGPSDTVSSDIRYCPKTDPDYPFCTGTTGNGCTGAAGSITASASTINLGQSVTVSWNGSLPSTCNGTFMMDGVPAPLTGSKTFTPRSSSNYVLQVDSKRIAIVHVDVNLPATVYINGNTQDWKNLFIQAIGTPNKRVVLAPTLELDLTGYDTLQIANGVTITSEQAPIVYATATALTVGRANRRNSMPIRLPAIACVSRPRAAGAGESRPIVWACLLVGVGALHYTCQRKKGRTDRCSDRAAAC